MQFFYRFLLQELRQVEGIDAFAKPLAAFATFLLIAIISYLAYLIARKFMMMVVHRFAAKTETKWDDILVENRVFKGVANLVPALIFFYTANFAGPDASIQISNLDPQALADLSKDFYINLDEQVIQINIEIF